MSYQATNGDGGGGISKGVTALSKAIGLIVSIFATPAIFNAIKPWLYGHLLRAWGEGIAGLLMWVVAAAGAYTIYAFVSLACTILAISAMTYFASKRFGG